MIVSDEDLFSMAEAVFASMLDLELAMGDPSDGKIGDRAHTACVQITGDWEGAVTVQCNSTLAAKIAASMFAMEPDEVGEEEIRDAFGEVANMTGGSVKGMAPGTNTLAIPTVVQGDENAMSFPKTVVENRVVGMCEGEPVIITVLAKS